MPECKMYRYDGQGFFEAEDVTYSDLAIDFVRDYRPPEMHTWTPPPKYDLSVEIPQYVKGEWRIVLLVSLAPPELTLDEIKAEKLAELAEARWLEETGGLTLPDGTIIKTDRESQGLLTGASLYALQNSTATVEWKGVSGWVTLKAQDVMTIAALVRNHVQACFSKERKLAEAVKAAEKAEAVKEIAW